MRYIVAKILLVLLCAVQPAVAAPLCAKVFTAAPAITTFGSSLSTLEAAVSRHLVLYGSISTRDNSRLRPLRLHDELNQVVEQISTPNEVLQLFAALNTIQGRQFYFEAGVAYYSGLRLFSFLPEIANSKIFARIISLKDQFTPDQQRQLFELVDSLKPSVSSESKDLKSYALQIQMIFHPDVVYEYIKLLPKRFLVTEWLSKENSAYFSDGTFLLLRSLPVEIRREASKISMQIYNDLHLERRDEFENALGVTKLNRRSYELVIWALSEPAIQKAWAQLQTQKKLPTQQAAQVVESVWRQQGFTISLHFARAVEIAKSLQSGPLKEILGDDYVEFYGSYLNGKATYTSDIDLHFSPRIDAQYRDLIGSHESYKEIRYTPQDPQATQRARSFSNQLLAVEESLARFMGKNSYEPTKLMSLRTENKPYFYIDGHYNLYNPFSLKIYKDKIYLRMYNGFSKEALEIELTHY